jgi:chitosanase
MPQKRSTAARPSRAKQKPAPKPSLAARIFTNRAAKPAVYVVAFMLFGAASIVWASAATTTYNLWGNAVPKTITADDRHNLELGMKFRAKVAGYVTGVRFYKSAQNTGTHTGSLWDSRGHLLATATFSKETASGWQSVNFSKQVSVAANVTYVVSYHAPKGHYSVNFHYFKKNVTNKNLVALRAGHGQANGVYRYSRQTTYPGDNGSGANYWVDVIFANKLVSAPVAPAAPGNLTANLSGSAVALRWQASVSANSIKEYDVYRGSSKVATTANTAYTDTAVKAGTTYSYTVKAVDTTGAVSVASNAVSVKLPAAGGSTGTGGGSTGGGTTTGGNGNGGSGGTSTGSTANLFNASKKEIAMELVSSAENSSLNWKAQYAYIEDIGDGRGYTAGIIGFCSGCGDMQQVVAAYTKASPNNVLAKYTAALQKVNGSASHTGLGNAFVADWKTAAKDPLFQKAQDNERDNVYFNPAVNQAISDGLHSLGQFIYYDAMVMHGPGDDPVSFGGIRAAALKKAKTPAQGGNETTYLNAYLDARKAAMKTEAAHDDTDRVDTEQRVFLNAGNLNLDVPLTWTVYGDPYSIKTNP